MSARSSARASRDGSRVLRFFPLLLLALSWLATSQARAADAEVFGRVVVPIAALRTGPGTSFRVLRVAQEGEAFPIVGRASRGYWLELELPDGGHAFVAGDAVYTYALGAEEAESHSRIFAPAPLARARGELAIGFGALDVNGLMAVRPSLLLSPTFGFEANLAAAIGSTGRLLIAGLGGIVNVLPTAKIVPFFAGGGGVAWAAPNADTFVLGAGTRSTIYAGGGLRFGFRHHLILRIEGRGYAFFDTDHFDAAAEGSGGLSAFF